MQNNWCEILQEEIRKIKEHQKNGLPLDWDKAQKLVIANEACMILEKEDYWRGYNEKYRGMVKTEEHSHEQDHSHEYNNNHNEDYVSYNHMHEQSQADKEISRIIESGNTDLMYKLSAALSEHFLYLQHLYPQMYDKICLKLKEII